MAADPAGPLGAALLGLLPALARDGQDVVVGDLDVDVILLEPRQVGAHHQLVAALEHLHLRSPESLLDVRQPRPEPAPEAGDGREAEAGAEQPIHVIREAAHEVERARRPRRRERARPAGQTCAAARLAVSLHTTLLLRPRTSLLRAPTRSRRG